MNNEIDKDLTSEDFNKADISTINPGINTFMDSHTHNQKINQELIGFFSLQGRSGRLEYLKIESMIILFLLINSLYFVPRANEEYITGFLITAWFITFLAIPITVRRLHDSNLSGWFYLISLIPNILLRANHLIFPFIAAGFGIYFLYLVLRSGDPYPNEYGTSHPTKEYGNKAVNLICILLFIMIVISGILATNS